MISSDGEWRAVRELIPEAVTKRAPIGESFESVVGAKALTFFHGGWGRVSASATTQFVIDTLQPELLINLGTCGGFQGRIERGRVILVDKTIIYDLLEQMTETDEAIGHYTTDLDLGWLPGSPPTPVWRGLMVSGDRDIVPADIPGLIRKFEAVAADWESGAIAWVAKKNHQRLLILRGVSDLVGSEGGEAYGDYTLYLGRAKTVMKGLIEALPKWLTAIEQVRQDQQI